MNLFLVEGPLHDNVPLVYKPLIQDGLDLLYFTIWDIWGGTGPTEFEECKFGSWYSQVKVGERDLLPCAAAYLRYALRIHEQLLELELRPWTARELRDEGFGFAAGWEATNAASP